MTELVLKSKLSQRKLKSIIGFLKAWDIDAEIRKTPVNNRFDKAETHFASEQVLAKEWLNPYEDKAWKDL